MMGYGGRKQDGEVQSKEGNMPKMLFAHLPLSSNSG